MPYESYAVLLQDARQRSYAVGAFNIFGIEFLPAILQAAQRQRSPALLQINPIHFHLTELSDYIGYVKAQIKKSPVPIGLNLDHGPDRATILKGIRAGFPSVMFDGSKLPFKDNLRKTAEIVELCHECGITVEAELGTLNDEGAELTDEVKARLFTDPGNAAEFITATGADGLAVAIGNAHGFYRGEPKLDLERLSAIREAVEVPLVLHGGSGLSDSDFRDAIARGICKINIYTEMSAAAIATVEENAQTITDYPTLLSQARDSVSGVVERKMRVFNSSGKC